MLSCLNSQQVRCRVQSSKSLKEKSAVFVREVARGDEKQLDLLEKACFASDRLNLRRFKYWIKASHRVFLVAESDSQILAYGLVLLHKGTRLARLYSLAVDDEARGRGIGRILLKALEEASSQQGKIYMRLEVAADNKSAIALYESEGYRVFSWLEDYYEDHRNALRMQKRIRYLAKSLLKHQTPWYRQTTEFSCGAAALMMAMKSLDHSIKMNQDEELDIWRQATTIFMTSGHGGSHPIGLALAARSRGFRAEVNLNQQGPLFVDSVRSEHKKNIISLVDRQFHKKAKSMRVKITKHDVTQEDIGDWLGLGKAVLILISTYRIDGRKAPHWVTVSGIDEHCLYVHDPDPATDQYDAFDCQYVPIARSDFEKMSSFGKNKLRTSVVISSN